MEKILLKYVGSRSFTKVMYQRLPYIFKKDNDFSCEVPQDLVDWLAQNAGGQYRVVPTKTVIKEVIKEVEVEKKLMLECDKCGFIAKTEQGLAVHKKKHERKGK